MGSQRVWHDWTSSTYIYYNEWYLFWKQIIVLDLCVNYECNSQIFDECYTVPGILDKELPFPHITEYTVQQEVQTFDNQWQGFFVAGELHSIVEEPKRAA